MPERLRILLGRWPQSWFCCKSGVAPHSCGKINLASAAESNVPPSVILRTRDAKHVRRIYAFHIAIAVDYLPLWTGAIRQFIAQNVPAARHG